MCSDSPVWLITGCSTGLGRELARAILGHGRRLVATARTPATLAEFAGHDGALVAALDVTVPGMILDVVAQAEARFGAIDVLVNNAGYGYLAALEEGEDAEVRALFETNVFGLINVTRAVLPGMRARRRGHIVNLSSMGGLIGFPGVG
jgi:NADP-dependent 3-hydroxy acid dehydrogenase YdfG